MNPEAVRRRSPADNVEKVMTEGPNPLSLLALHGLHEMLLSMAAKKKHLLRQLVKKVLIHSRQTIEVWNLDHEKRITMQQARLQSLRRW